MSGPTPILATHRLQFQITVHGILRRQNFYCSAVANPASTPPFDLVAAHSLGNVPMAGAIDAYFTNIRVLYDAATTLFGVTNLQKYNPTDGSYTTIASYSTGVAPTGTVTLATCQGWQAETWAYDNTRSKLSIHVPESAFNGFQRFTSVAVVPSSALFMVDKLVLPTVNTDMGAWAQSRSGLAPDTLISWIVGPNRRYRRERGVA